MRDHCGLAAMRRANEKLREEVGISRRRMFESLRMDGIIRGGSCIIAG